MWTCEDCVAHLFAVFRKSNHFNNNKNNPDGLQLFLMLFFHCRSFQTMTWALKNGVDYENLLTFAISLLSQRGRERWRNNKRAHVFFIIPSTAWRHSQKYLSYTLIELVDIFNCEYNDSVIFIGHLWDWFCGCKTLIKDISRIF